MSKTKVQAPVWSETMERTYNRVLRSKAPATPAVTRLAVKAACISLGDHRCAKLLEHDGILTRCNDDPLAASGLLSSLAMVPAEQLDALLLEVFGTPSPDYSQEIGGKPILHWYGRNDQEIIAEAERIGSDPKKVLAELDKAGVNYPKVEVANG